MNFNELDTPFNRYHVNQMTYNELQAHVEKMRERRMAAVRLFRESQLAKAKAKTESDVAQFDKTLAKAEKKLEAIDKAFDMLDKYLADLQVLRLSIGDNPWEKSE